MKLASRRRTEVEGGKRLKLKKIARARDAETLCYICRSAGPDDRRTMRIIQEQILRHRVSHLHIRNPTSSLLTKGGGDSDARRPWRVRMTRHQG
jgi:hypothetical protein